jgi:hypothetical protein
MDTDTPLTLHRTDPITPEALVRMGAIIEGRWYTWHYQPDCVPLSATLQDKWRVVVRDVIQDLRDLGHLHDLLTALGVQVPPLGDTNKGGE